MRSPHIPLPHLDTVFFAVEYLGIFVGALGGAMSAIRNRQYKYDIVGVFGLALASALGGGVLRDIVLQEGPPLAFEHIAYLITAMIGALVAVLFGRWFSERTDRTIVVVDAAAIGLFAVAGTTRALDAGLRELAALLLGITTAVGGGSLRDVLSGRPPKIFERGQLYAVAALLGSAVFLLCDYYGFSRTASTAVGTSSCFLLRILAWRYDWRTPHIGTEDQT